MNTVRQLALVALALALLCGVALADGGGVKFTAAELAQLKDGKVVRQELPSSRKGGFYGGTGWAVINAPADRIWAALVDWGQYKDAFPHTEEMFEISRRGDRSLVRMRLGHPVISVTNHLEMKRDAARKTLSFEMLDDHPHDLDMIKGYWRLFPQEGDRTLVAYVLAIKVPMGILGAPGFLKSWVETGKPNS